MPRLSSSVRSPGGWKKSPPRRTPQLSSRKSSSSRRRGFLKTLIIRMVVAGVILGVAGALFLTFAIAALSRNLPQPDRLIDRSVAISTKIYDREGKVLLYDIHGDAKRTPIALSQIAPLAIKETLVAEDRNFYKHGGFDLKGIIRSFFLDIFKGGALRGGSTITQQFVKNAVLTSEKTLTRKLKELVLSYRIEKRFTKDEILTMYFNEIPYGSTAYGIEAAAQGFFGKSAKDLDLIEGAILAAVPQAPTRLSPYGNHTEDLVARVHYIINGMVDEGYLTKEQGALALKEDILKRVKPRRENILAPHFVMYVKDQLVQKYGEDFVERGGLKVITTLDWGLQQIAEDEITKGALTNAKINRAENAALVAEDPKTGQLLSMVGSRGYFDPDIDGNVNVAIRPRQPGSSFKPIVYAAAFEKGFTPDTPLWDVLTVFKTDTKDYLPHNYNGKEYGLITMRKALAGSLNVPAVKTLYLTGIDRVLDLAGRLGYTTFEDRSRFGLSLVLGGGEVKLIDHVGAFATLANDGMRIPQSTLLRIEDSSGRVLEEWQPPQGAPALDKTLAREVTSILTDNGARTFIFGAKSPLILSDRLIAAKTGTTNDWRDGWTMGFVPSLAAGVWTGNNDFTPMRQGADGVVTAGPIWRAFMERALKLKGVAPEKFPAPDPRPVVSPLLRGQGFSGTKINIDKSTGLPATDTTPIDQIEERTFMSAHSELYYFNKDDLATSPPDNPGKDPQFESWEYAVQHYAETHGILTAPSTPGAPGDASTTPSSSPDGISVSFANPSSGITVGDGIFVEVRASSSLGITKVELSRDGSPAGEATQAPYTFTLGTAAWAQGSHTLTATAYTSSSSRSASITINK